MQLESGVFVEPGRDVGVFVGGELSRIMCMSRPFGTSRSTVRRNFRNSWCRCLGRHEPITLPVSTSSAANRVVVVAFVVVGHRLGAAGNHRQRGLGAVSACADDFSSMHSTIALSGGFRYRPTTSISFSSNFGSLDSLKVFTRCGLRPRAAHTRCTVSSETPTSWPSTDNSNASSPPAWNCVSDRRFRRSCPADGRLLAATRAHLIEFGNPVLGEPLPPPGHGRRAHTDPLPIRVLATPSLASGGAVARCTCRCGAV